jgi:hypothetical protein
MMDDDAGSGAIDHDITAIRSAIEEPRTRSARTEVPGYISVATSRSRSQAIRRTIGRPRLTDS